MRATSILSSRGSTKFIQVLKHSENQTYLSPKCPSYT